jgi:hypothetical protein
VHSRKAYRKKKEEKEGSNDRHQTNTRKASRKETS